MTATLSMDLCLEADSAPDFDESHFRILVVDGECSIRELIAEMLGGTGYEVESAADAMEAMEKLQERHFDLLLTGYNMPRMNGLDLISHIRAAGFEIPAVLMSGRAAELLAGQADLPVSVVIPKPFLIDELLGVVSSVLASSHLPQTSIIPPKHLLPQTAFKWAGHP